MIQIGKIISQFKAMELIVCHNRKLNCTLCREIHKRAFSTQAKLV